MQTCIVQVHDMIGYDIHVRYTERYIMVDICIIYISCLKKIHCTKFGYVCTTLKKEKIISLDSLCMEQIPHRYNP